MPSFAFHATIGPNPATELVAGQSAELFRASRFAQPATNAAVPDGLAADYGSLTTDTVVDFYLGGVEVTTTTFETFYVRFWDPADTTNSGGPNYYWTTPTLPASATNLEGWSAAANFTRTMPVAAVTATLSAVQYTSADTTHFLGCTGGTATLHTGDAVIQAFMNGPNRRQVTLASTAAVTGSTQSSQIFGYSTVTGSLQLITSAGITSWAGTFPCSLTESETLPVDPGGVYGFWPVVTGGGTLPVVASWTEVDH
jgi:hypothetical protein